MKLEEFAEQEPKKVKCRVCQLPPDVLEQVNEAQGRIPGTQVARWLKSEGHPPGDHSIRRHWSRCLA